MPEGLGRGCPSTAVARRCAFTAWANTSAAASYFSSRRHDQPGRSGRRRLPRGELAAFGSRRPPPSNFLCCRGRRPGLPTATRPGGRLRWPGRSPSRRPPTSGEVVRQTAFVVSVGAGGWCGSRRRSRRPPPRPCQWRGGPAREADAEVVVLRFQLSALVEVVERRLHIFLPGTPGRGRSTLGQLRLLRQCGGRVGDRRIKRRRPARATRAGGRNFRPGLRLDPRGGASCRYAFNSTTETCRETPLAHGFRAEVDRDRLPEPVPAAPHCCRRWCIASDSTSRHWLRAAARPRDRLPAGRTRRTVPLTAPHTSPSPPLVYPPMMRTSSPSSGSAAASSGVHPRRDRLHPEQRQVAPGVAVDHDRPRPAGRRW